MTKKTQFAHLHSHTDHSVLDGHASVNELAQFVHANGDPGFAVTDHGSMSNIYNGWSAAKKIRETTGDEFHFIPGIEAYVVPGDAHRSTREPIFFSSGSREDKTERSNDVSGGGAYTHMTLLAATNEGMQNLFRLNTLAWHEGIHRKPRMDIESISKYSNGVIGTTGCPSGELQTRLRLGQWKEAMAYASKMQDILGKENYFLELMDHDMSIDLERKVRADLMKVAKELNIPLLATNDLHYVRREDAQDHEHMLCIQSGSSMLDQPYDKGGKRFAFEGTEYYAKPVDDMLRLFPHEDYPYAVQNAADLVKRSNVEFIYNPDLRPSVPLPEGHDEHSYLRLKVMEGLNRKRPDKVNDPEYVARMETELGVLKEKNFSGYMLVVADFMNWANDQGFHTGPGRGSGGGSLVAYATGITDIDPIPHGLIFERFLNPERDSPPDIDSDFDDINREKVIAYVREKYGDEMVSMIITFGVIKAKSAIKDIARIYEEPFSVGETLTKALPPAVAGKEISLKEVYDKNAERYPEAEKFREEASRIQNKNLISYALGIEGKMRQTGVHAAGVIMSSKPLKDSIPLMMRNKDNVTITQFDYPTCEALGLIKMDFLGLRNLTVIDKAIKSIERNHGVKIIPHDVYDSVLENPDQKTFDIINAGRTLGVFQLDSPGITSLARLINITSFGDISAILALYRPGPMGMESHIRYADRKNGREEIVPIHPELEEPLAPIIGDTFNLVVYQEQIQFIAQKVAGYSLGQADILRRAMGKKKKAILDAEFVPFSEGMKKNSYSDDAIQTLWDTLVPFAAYGFNRSHSAGYALVSYLTAYLKANYGPEFMAANLSTLTGDKEKTAQYLNECRHMGIKVLPPDVSRSTADYTATPEGTVLVGLEAIRGVGHEVANDLSREVVENGEFKDLNDFLARAPSSSLSKGALEGFAHGGALDRFGFSRRALHTSLPESAKGFAQATKKKDAGQFSLFDMVDESAAPTVNIQDLPEYVKKDKLMFERHALGLYVSDHPLSGIANMLERFSDTQAVDVSSGAVKPSGSFGDRVTLRFAGVANSVEKRPTRKGGMFASFELEDISGTIPCLIFPKGFERMGHKLDNDTIYIVTGSLLAGDSEDDVKLAVDDIEEISLTDTGMIPFDIHIRMSQANEPALEDLSKVLQGHPGEMPVYLHVTDSKGKVQVFELGEHLKVGASKTLERDVRMLFGVHSVK